MISLRDYQVECLKALPEQGRVAICMATGLGKTATFSQIPRRGRMLILAHREELLRQPKQYFECSYGINSHSNEDVVAFSVQTLVRRLNKFKPDEFDVIVVDEFHRAAAKTYVKILEYFKPRLLVGVSATPRRSDGEALDGIFDEIVYERDLRYGIENKYLSGIDCLSVDIGYNLSSIKTQLGDLDSGQLDREMRALRIVEAVAETYHKHAVGQTVIFGCSIQHCELIAERIKGSAIITGKTKDRKEILQEFQNKKIKCIVNCMVLTEGTDLPCIETIIMARPTKSQSLYIQCVGRGARLYPGKDKLKLIDCVGVTGEHDICSPATLVGMSHSSVPNKEEVEGDIFDLPEKIQRLSDVPESWIKNTKIVSIYAKKNKYHTHNVNYFKMPDGAFVVQLKAGYFKIYPIDQTGWTYIEGRGYEKKKVKAQQAFDAIYKVLNSNFDEERYIWDLTIAKKWGRKEASDKQKMLIKQRLPNFKVDNLTKIEASHILNRLFFRGR